MPGFLDSKERVIDMVLTDTGKSLLLKGDLHFVYWVPFDDEVDYDPVVTYAIKGSQIIPSSSLDAGDIAARKQVLTESPLIREATMGYRGPNLREEDTTNIIRPMYSAHPGVGQSGPLPQLLVSLTGSQDGTTALTGVQVQIKQAAVKKYYGDATSPSLVEDVGIMRYSPSLTTIDVQYENGGYPADAHLEGFLVTMYQSSSVKTDPSGNVVGGYQEILHTFDSTGSIAYLNDLQLINYTP